MVHKPIIICNPEPRCFPKNLPPPAFHPNRLILLAYVLNPTTHSTNTTARLTLFASLQTFKQPIYNPTPCSSQMNANAFTMSSISSSSSSPQSVKRVRFSPDVKDSDDLASSSSSDRERNSPRVIPRTPKRPTYGAFQLSPAMSDTSSGMHHSKHHGRGPAGYLRVHDFVVVPEDVDLLVHSLLLPPPTSQRVVYDVRTHPMQAYIHAMPPFPLAPHYSALATQPALRRVQLVSRILPWTIVVENPMGVTIGDILYRVHASLSKTVAKEEYESVKDGSAQARILQAYKRNCTPTPGLPSRTREEGLKRIDFLTERTFFSGIQKDMEFLNSRVRDPNMRAESFVLEFASAS